MKREQRVYLVELDASNTKAVVRASTHKRACRVLQEELKRKGFAVEMEELYATEMDFFDEKPSKRVEKVLWGRVILSPRR